MYLNLVRCAAFAATLSLLGGCGGQQSSGGTPNILSSSQAKTLSGGVLYWKPQRITMPYGSKKHATLFWSSGSYGYVSTSCEDIMRFGWKGGEGQKGSLNFRRLLIHNISDKAGKCDFTVYWDYGTSYLKATLHLISVP